METVLIVDNDLGFVFWLGKTLNAAGYEALPAKDAADASALLGELDKTPDLLIVNPALPRIDSLIDRLRRTHKQLKVIAIGAFAEPDISNAEAKSNPSAFDESYKERWLDIVRKVMEDPAPARIKRAG